MKIANGLARGLLCYNLAIEKQPLLRFVVKHHRLCPVVWLCVTACAGKTPPKDFVNEELGGMISGREWQYKHAYIDPTVDTPEEEDVVFIILPYKPKSECPTAEELGSDNRTVMISAPKSKKLTKLKGGTGRNLVFQVEKKGQQFATVAKGGKIQLTQVTSRSVKGKIFGTFDQANWVSGNFKAVLCDFRKPPTLPSD